MGKWSERAKQLQQEAPQIYQKGMAAPEPGMAVHYLVPVFESDKHIGWKEHAGRVELVDSVRQMALIIPKDETYAWLWVAMVYVQSVPTK